MPAETVDAALHRGARYLSRRKIEDALRSARLLLAAATHASPSALLARLRDPLSAAEGRRYGQLLCARARHRPLQYLLGTWEFIDFELEVGPEALIPRPETELLVERALELLGRGEERIADVGTGTGAIAIAVARALPRARLFALDRSPAALELAARNVARHRLEGRIRLLESDLLQALDAEPELRALDAVLSNPPYVTEGEWPSLMPEVRDHEPRQALVAGPTGLEVYARLAPEARIWLRPGGLIAVEVGAGQSQAVAGILTRSGFTDVETHADGARIPRVLTARREA